MLYSHLKYSLRLQFKIFLLTCVDFAYTQVEYGIFKVDPESKTVKLSLRGGEVSTCIKIMISLLVSMLCEV